MIEVTLGIDIGGTNTVFGLVDKNGELHFESAVPTRSEYPVNELFDNIFNTLNETLLNGNRRYKLSGIGVGAPNGNYFTGCIENPPNLKWDTTNLVDIIKKYKDVPTVITNDANAAALGEMYFGVAQGMKNFVEITLGTGLGSGIVTNGKLIYGQDGFAGELGHITVQPNDRLCGCGRKGCLETYASATGIVNTAIELLRESQTPSLLRNLPAKDITSKAIYQAAIKSDVLALKAFNITGTVLGKAMANTVAHLSPEAIILFGGLANAADLIINPTKQAMEDNLLFIYKNKVKILHSGLPDGQAAILGAGALIWSVLNGK